MGELERHAWTTAGTQGYKDAGRNRDATPPTSLKTRLRVSSVKSGGSVNWRENGVWLVFSMAFFFSSRLFSDTVKGCFL